MRNEKRRRRRMAVVVLAVFSVCGSLATSAGAQEVFLDSLFAVQMTDSIVYGTAPIRNPSGDFELLLDLYEPIGLDAPPVRPGLIAVHGGSFTYGSRKEPLLVRLCENMAGRGYTAISIDYRLSGQRPVNSPEFQPLVAAMIGSGWPPSTAEAVGAAVEDATTSHRWMVANAAALNVDTTRIAVGGTSAGAITSLMLAYCLDDFGVSELPEIGAVMDLWGALYGFVDSMESGESPLIIVHGEEDDVVPFSHAEALVAQAQAVGVPYEFYPIAGAGHGVDIFVVEAAPGETLFDRIVEFFYDHLDLAGLLAGTESVVPPVLTARLDHNSPNPFSRMTTIHFYLAEPQQVRLEVYTVGGRLVTTLVSENMPSGSHEVTWNGRGRGGRVVAAGIYIYRLRAGDFIETRRMVLVK
jgi:acetyl esterase/lipase